MFSQFSTQQFVLQLVVCTWFCRPDLNVIYIYIYIYLDLEAGSGTGLLTFLRETMSDNIFHALPCPKLQQIHQHGGVIHGHPPPQQAGMWQDAFGAGQFGWRKHPTSTTFLQGTVCLWYTLRFWWYFITFHKCIYPWSVLPDLPDYGHNGLNLRGAVPTGKQWAARRNSLRVCFFWPFLALCLAMLPDIWRASGEFQTVLVPLGCSWTW